MKRYPFWSYLTISAIDAPLISVAWYLYFAKNSTEAGFNLPHCCILGFSVWLGYMADRLFDIRFNKNAQWVSFRHQFCKQHEITLWTVWTMILIPTVIFSLYVLNSDKIFVGLSLIFFILLYNLLNQVFSNGKFPKEICVALLFAFGTLFLLEDSIKLENLAHFSLVCFLNCLIITHKDKHVDKLMRVSSWTHSFRNRSIFTIIALAGIYFLITFQSVLNPFFITCASCAVLHAISYRMNEEAFRVTTESLYASIPILALFCL